jgi:hypothetical protein
MRTIAVAVAFVALAAGPAAAQGHGKALGKGRAGPVTSGSATAAATASSTGVRQFGSWLDDASVLGTGNAWTAISFGHYRTPFSHQTDFPIADVSVGVTRRAQVGVTVPYYRLQLPDGSSLNGIGDMYFSTKLSIVDPHEKGRRVGLAVSPTVELLDTSATEAGRFGWGAPVSLEFRGKGYRVFGSTGYFSRGAVFGSSAVEIPVQERLMITTALSVMRAINNDPVADTLQLPKTRTDLNGVAAYFLAPSVAVFGGAGRTISNAAAGGTSLMVTGGISFTLTPRVTP